MPKSYPGRVGKVRITSRGEEAGYRGGIRMGSRQPTFKSQLFPSPVCSPMLPHLSKPCLLLCKMRILASCNSGWCGDLLRRLFFPPSRQPAFRSHQNDTGAFLSQTERLPRQASRCSSVTRRSRLAWSSLNGRIVSAFSTI